MRSVPFASTLASISATAVALAVALVSSVPARAADAPAAFDAPAAIAAKGPDAKTASLKRTLASALVLKRLQLSPEQKRELTSIVADAKALREKAREQAQRAAPIDDRTRVLEKAIDEARATGRISSETKVAMTEMRTRVKEGTESLKGERKAIATRLKALLTPDQVEALKGLRDELPPPARARAESVGGRHAGRGMILRLLMSDEFAAELARR